MTYYPNFTTTQYNYTSFKPNPFSLSDLWTIEPSNYRAATVQKQSAGRLLYSVGIAAE